MPALRLIPFVLLLLAGCQQPTPGNAGAPAATPDDYLIRMAALPAAQQQMVLFRAIRDAQQECSDIRQTERMPDQAGHAVWRVTCRGGGQLAVSISADGIADVTAPRR